MSYVTINTLIMCFKITYFGNYICKYVNFEIFVVQIKLIRCSV